MLDAVQETRAGTGSQTKFLLQESELPRRWYNIRSDMPTAPQPVLHPGTGQPVGPDDLAPLFPMELIGQEVSEEAEIAIPEEVLDIYRLWRPTPLYRAHRLEAAIGTRSRIFYKYEGVSPAGSHKPNTAVAQAFYNKQEGRTRLSTETGAGQWGSALSFACKLLGLECKVYMVRISYDQKPFRRSMIQAWGAEIVASPSQDTQSGRAILEEHPDSPGSLGIAISEAVEDAAGRDDTAYSLGSVLNHVLLHQTVIGQEALAQMELAEAFPDVVIGCVGGGSNFAGLAFPFLREKIAGRDIDVLACEPAACPTLTRGLFAYDFGDTGKLTPLVPMHTLGHDFIPAPIHAGGLRYHGVAPLISQLVRDGLIRAEAYLQNDVFASAVLFAGSEGILPAPEAAHAIHGALQVAKAADEAGEERTILFNLSGPRPLRHGRVRQLLRRPARGRRIRRRRDGARAGRARRTAEHGLNVGRAGAERRDHRRVPGPRGASRRLLRGQDAFAPHHDRREDRPDAHDAGDLSGGRRAVRRVRVERRRAEQPRLVPQRPRESRRPRRGRHRVIPSRCGGARRAGARRAVPAAGGSRPVVRRVPGRDDPRDARGRADADFVTRTLRICQARAAVCAWERPT